MKKSIFLVFSFLFLHPLFAQNNSCSLRISLLTCTPGEELYSTFGHSAIRVTDSLHNTDIIFNYGTFDFNDPDFYSKFVKGKLLYFVSVEEVSNFMYEYQSEHRGITEQVLNLSCTEKEKLVAALKENAKGENKYYKYDFIHDNCTTRLRDMVFKNVNEKPTTKDIRPDNKTTFRKLLHEYLNKGHEYWSELGIDIILGRSVDKNITNEEAMFLPDYLMKAFDSTTLTGKPLVVEKKVILNSTLQFKKNILLSPLFIFGFLFLIIAGLSFSKNTQKFFSFFDPVLFFASGLAGVLILFMWLGTDHEVCRNNFNILWALPTHLFIPIFIHKKWKWVKYYFLVSSILVSLFFFISWLVVNELIIGILLILFLRSFLRYKKIKDAEKNSGL